MKTTLLSFMLLFVIGIGASTAQERVTESRLIGNWRMVIDIETEIRNEVDQEESTLARMFMRGITGMVQSIIDDIDIQMTFKKGSVLELVALYDGKVDDVEMLNWTIDDKGRLYIDDFKNGNIKFESDGYWMLENGRLVSFEEDGTRNDNVWMEKD